MPEKSEVVQIYYDLRVAPITFDASTFFAVAVGTLRREGYKFFDVNVVGYEYRNASDREKAYTLAQRGWRVANILAKLPLLIPGVLNVYLTRSPRILLGDPRYPEKYDPSKPKEPPYTLRDMVDTHKSGADVQIFSATDYARDWARGKLKSGKAIVIPLRSADFHEGRDSPLENIFALYRHLSSSGYRVVVIPDQNDVLNTRQFSKYNWETIPEAAIDLDLRLALYQAAYANIAWGGGIGALFWYSKVRFIMFGLLNSNFQTASPDHFERQGFVVGQNPPFLSQGQVVDWTDAANLTAGHLIERTDAYLASL